MTNNQKLIKLMRGDSGNYLTARTVAEILPSCSESSVNSWTQNPRTEGSRNMPTAKLKLLEILLKQKVKKCTK